MTTPDITDLLRRCRAVIDGGGWTELEADIAKALALPDTVGELPERPAADRYVFVFDKDGFSTEMEARADYYAADQMQAYARAAIAADRARRAGDEREAFEAWCFEVYGYRPEPEVDCKFTPSRTADRWEGWQARAALDSPATAEDCSGVHPAPDAAALVEAVRAIVGQYRVFDVGQFEQSVSVRIHFPSIEAAAAAFKNASAALAAYDQQTGGAS